MRQGGVLSPDLYSIYVDELICILRKSGVGCYICKIFAAALFYADDMAILAPSLKGLQMLLNLCQTYCVECDILLNAKKTKNMFFGKGVPPTFRLSLDNQLIPRAPQWNYLGVTLMSGKCFNSRAKESIASFYRTPYNGLK